VFSHYHQKYFNFGVLAKTLISYQQYLFLPIMGVARWNLYVQSLMHTSDIAYIAVFWGWFSLLLFFLQSWKIRLVFLASSHIFAGILHLQIVLSHFSMPVYDGRTFEAPIGEEFFRQQCHTCMDLHSNWINDWFYGGLQFQLAHHLFPRIPRHNLRNVQQKVQAICREHGVDYKIVGWWQGVWGILQTLASVAEKAQITDTSTHLHKNSHIRRNIE
jgi:hypothetical protein